MVWLGRLWRWGSGLVIAAFVVVYLSAVLLHNTFHLFDNLPSSGPPGSMQALIAKSDKLSTDALTATGTSQRWNMFAPNVGTLSYSPIVVIVFKDGGRLALHSPVEPELPGWDKAYPITNDVEGAAREYNWRFHWADGRIRKFESRAASVKPNWWKVRTTYTRWRAQRWIDQHPERKDEILRIELWRAKIRHPGYGRSFTCEAVEILPVSPRSDPLWPIDVEPYFLPYGP